MVQAGVAVLELALLGKTVLAAKAETVVLEPPIQLLEHQHRMPAGVAVE
jgi:hypothetical protein